MSAIEINKDMRVGFEEIIRGAQKLDNSALEKFASEINRLVSSRNIEKRVNPEIDLLKKIKTGIPASLKRRQKQLYVKMQENSISDVEHHELVLLNNMIEEKTADKILYMGKLAKLRGISIQQLSAHLDVKAIHE